MDPFHKRGSVDLVHILMDVVHEPSLQRGFMFCTFPPKNTGECFTTSLKSICKNSGTFEGKQSHENVT